MTELRPTELGEEEAAVAAGLGERESETGEKVAFGIGHFGVGGAKWHPLTCGAI